MRASKLSSSAFSTAVWHGVEERDPAHRNTETQAISPNQAGNGPIRLISHVRLRPRPAGALKEPGAGADKEGTAEEGQSRSAAIRSMASVRISGLVPKFSRTCPAPSAPNAGPKCRATFASRRIRREGLSPQPRAERLIHAR